MTITGFVRLPSQVVLWVKLERDLNIARFSPTGVRRHLTIICPKFRVVTSNSGHLTIICPKFLVLYHIHLHMNF